jgi:hypothetical protein
MMKKLSILATLLIATAFASAATLKGVVKNQTTGKPAAGDEVALLQLSQGMNELASTKTDANGNFSFEVQDSGTPHLVRVMHDGVTYFPPGGPIRPGVTNVEIPVYDGAKKVDGVNTTVNVMRLQADGNNLQVLELIAIKNDSKPPRAVMADRSYAFYIPESAQVDQIIAQAPGGMPVNTQPVADKGGKYFLNYALKPGETRFEIAYHVPYSGEATFAPRIADNTQHFVVMMPKSMKFEAKSASQFSPMNDDSSATIQVATNVTPNSDIAFRVSGTGLLPDEQQGGGGDQQASSAGSGAMGGGAAAGAGPGGGLGAPIDTPDPLYKYRAVILAGLAIVLVSGGVFVVSRANQQMPLPSPSLHAANRAAVSASPERSAPAPAAPPAKDRSGMLLEALKEELFQLEVERQQGKISAEEYEKSKAALGQTLSRAISRQGKS